MKGVTLRRLEILAALRAGCGLTKAAGTASRQSQFSRQLQELERATGLSLVERGRRPLVLTRKGEEISGICQQLMDCLRGREVERSNGEIVIAGGEMALVEWMIPKLSPLIPSIRTPLRFQNMRGIEALKGVREGRIDLALATQTTDLPGLIVEEMVDCGYLVLSREQGIGPLAPVRLSELVHHPLALIEGRTPLRNAVEREAERQKSKMKIPATCSTYEQVLGLVARTGLLGVVPAVCRSAAKRACLGIRRLDSGNRALSYRLWAISRRPGEHDEDLRRVMETIGFRHEPRFEA